MRVMDGKGSALPCWVRSVAWLSRRTKESPRGVFHASFDVAVSLIAVGAVENLRADLIRQPVLETVSDLKPILVGAFHERVEYAVVLFGVTRADALSLLNRIVLDSLT